MHQKIDTTISFYKFTNISNLEDNRAKIHEYLKKLNIYGTVIIASEGINANFCGSKVNIELCRVFISKLLSLGNIHYNRSAIRDRVFTKLKVKIKDEIIKAGFTISEETVSNNNSLEPRDWDKLLDQKPLIIDMRNRFEYLLGTFENSKSLELLNFSDLKESLEKTKGIDTNRDVAIFCTGGIRCEKAALALKEIGFNSIFQLKGGIINYLDQGKGHNKWEGECFVFDDRITY
tara:strand:- start:5 stop:703 length:699 start_codon:yes stop_codon:yes gene_type:complete